MIEGAHIDYEVRSRVDLKSCGAYRYAIDPSTDILMAGVSEDDSDRVLLWINPKFAIPEMPGDDNEEAEDILRRAKLRKAHNTPFELAVTWGADQRKAASPFKTEPPIDSWRDTAAVARKAGLPWSLEMMGEALNLSTQKDKEGKALIQFFCIPRKDGKFNEPRDHVEKWLKFCSYCKTDVVAEKLGDKKLKPFELQGDTLQTFLFDLRMNHRGIPINIPAAINAQRIINEVQADIGKRFREKTGLNPSQREKVRLLVELPDMQAETVEDALTKAKITAQVDPQLIAPGTLYFNDPDGFSEYQKESAERAELLEMYQKLSYAAVKKIQTMLDCVCPDGRIRGTMLYYGAGTGRWSGRLLQPQNFKKTSKDFKGLTEGIYAQICKSSDPAPLEAVWGEPIELIANSIRHFIHDPKTPLFDGDYNAIEGRIGCWIAGQADILEDWRQNKDLYIRAAAFVFNMPESSVGKGPKRDFGKVVELACQFGLGTDGFMRTCDKFGVPCDEKLAKRAVHEYYRPTHRKIVARWYYLDDQMRESINNPNRQCGPFTTRVIAGIKYLLLKLPSGRSLAYPHPEIKRREPTPAERKEMEGGKNYPPNRFLEVTYWGEIKAGTWGRVKLHGAKIFENEVQAIAGDFMAHGAITAEKRGMEPFMLVHDQALAYFRAGLTVEDFERALGDLPVWAKGMPLRVEAKITPFYTK